MLVKYTLILFPVLMQDGQNLQTIPSLEKPLILNFPMENSSILAVYWLLMAKLRRWICSSHCRWGSPENVRTARCSLFEIRFQPVDRVKFKCRTKSSALPCLAHISVGLAYISVGFQYYLTLQGNLRLSPGGIWLDPLRLPREVHVSSTLPLPQGLLLAALLTDAESYGEATLDSKKRCI